MTAATDAIQDIYPLSPMQAGMLFHTVYAPDSAVYVGQFHFALEGELHEAAFRRAWSEVMERHAVLRTAFAWEGLDEPLQVVYDRVPLPLRREDWRGTEEDERAARLAALLAADRARGIHPASAPLMRLTLVRMGERLHHLLWTHHHLLLDGWSAPLVLGEVMALYEAFRAGRPPRLPRVRPYRDYIDWLAARDDAGDEAFWRRELAGVPGPTRVGHARAGDAHGDGPCGLLTRRLGRAETAALREAARRHGLTLHTLVQGAWAILLARHAGERSVVFGTTVSGRPPELEGVEGMVGLFINTLPSPVQVPPDAPLVPWLRALQAADARRREHGHAPLVRVQGWSRVPRGVPLFESILVFQNVPAAPGRGETADDSGLSARVLPTPIRTGLPLALNVGPGPELELNATWEPARLDAAAVGGLLDQMAVLLGEIAAAPPGRRLGGLRMLDAAGRAAALAASVGPGAPVPGGCVHEMFARQAARTPDAVAIAAADGERVTYAGLDRRANRLARHLRARGVGPEARVAILLERGPRAVAATLGVMKAGGACVPLDPAYPPERIRWMLEDAAAVAVLTETRLLDRLASSPVPRVVLDGADAAAAEAEDGSAPDVRVDPANLAWVVYTSGSTGRPKGVLAAHRGAVSFLAFLAAEYGTGPADAVLQLASPAFDASYRDTLGPLTTGARLVIPAPGETAEPARLLARMRAEHVTAVMAAVPSMLRPLLAAAEADAGGGAPGLRLLLLSGEPLPADDARRARRVFGAGVRVVNQWGATECTMCSTFHTVDDGERAAVAPVGRPIANTRAYVLDAALEPVPFEVPGEAYLASPGLARGYLGRPVLTAERFVPDPLAATPGARMYRVGDRVRRRADGVLEYLGRADRQVKVQGVRVEPGEVESALRALAAVRDAAVEARETAPGEHRLVAWVVPGQGDASPAALRAALARTLPAALVPARFVTLSALPLLPNGKLDRAALAEPDQPEDAGAGHAPPRTPAEAVLAAIWADVLGVPRVGADDDFFALGGHSLLAMRAAARVREAFGAEVPLAAFFEDPSPARLARRLEALGDGGGPPLLPVPREAGLPLSFAQERVWLAHRFDPASATWNMPFPLRLRGPLRPAALARALAALVERHEVLRTRFLVRGDGEPVQLAAPPMPVPLPVVDLRPLPPAAREAALLRLARTEAARPFDLAHPPQLRATLARLAEEEHGLLLTLHHASADGWTLEVLARELAEVYAAFRDGRPPRLPELPVQYADYAAWQRARLHGAAREAQLAWWRTRLAGAPPALALPTDFAPPAAVRDVAGVVQAPLPAGAVEALEALARRESATLFMALLGAFAVLLFRHSGDDDLVIGAPSANRTRPEVQALAGFFVNLLPLRVRLAGNPAFRALLRQVRETALGAYTHAEIPFETLVQELGVARLAGRRPLAQVALELEAGAGDRLSLAEVEVSRIAVQTRRAKFDLELRVIEGGAAGHVALLYYDASLFRAESAAGLLAAFAAVVRQLADDPDRRVLDVTLPGDEPAAAPLEALEPEFAF